MKYIPLILVLIFFSCKPEKKESISALSSFDVNKKDILLNANLSNVISIDSLVFLEYSNQSIIGEIDKVLVTQDRIYIFDRLRSKSIFCFDRSGNFINSYRSIGRGPKEYTDILDVSFFEDEMYVLAAPERFFVLDKDLNFHKSIDIKWGEDVPFVHPGYHHFTMLNSDTILFYHPTACYHYYFYSLSKEAFVSSQIKRRGTMDRANFTHLTRTISEEVFVTQRFNDTIYQFTNNLLLPKYFVNFESPMSETEIKKYLDATPYTMFNYPMPHQMYDVMSFVENDSYVFFNFYYDNMFHFYFYDIERTRIMIIPHSINNDIWESEGFYGTYGHYGNSLITLAQPYFFIDNQGYMEFELPDDFTYASNPVLVFYQPKFE
ncbi:6-bladed beta-propeller [Natronoflexus pectinivorans]|uniref:6-bladed beta-propeller protein n=1 Tax=Natronoflexus pectinivorans TaxID=682526 RepID=A0A4R2GI53_9BACT|nr:6-bladed beta-propeller [Natronoflexus pectinivorans]TCO08220.1 6-bladed beta-propeller protein [Natronoflexus pectinivorans]